MVSADKFLLSVINLLQVEALFSLSLLLSSRCINPPVSIPCLFKKYKPIEFVLKLSTVIDPFLVLSFLSILAITIGDIFPISTFSTLSSTLIGSPIKCKWDKHPIIR